MCPHYSMFVCVHPCVCVHTCMLLCVRACVCVVSPISSIDVWPTLLGAGSHTTQPLSQLLPPRYVLFIWVAGWFLHQVYHNTPCSLFLSRLGGEAFEACNGHSATTLSPFLYSPPSEILPSLKLSLSLFLSGIHREELLAGYAVFISD